jgi:hypothetical protein
MHDTDVLCWFNNINEINAFYLHFSVTVLFYQLFTSTHGQALYFVCAGICQWSCSCTDKLETCKSNYARLEKDLGLVEKDWSQ